MNDTTTRDDEIKDANFSASHRMSMTSVHHSLFSVFVTKKPAIPDFNYEHQRLITLQIVKRSFVVLFAVEIKIVAMTCVESSSCVYFFNLPNGTKSLTKSKLFQRVSEAHFNSVNISRALKGEKSLPFNLFRGNFSGGKFTLTFGSNGECFFDWEIN